jgi:crossover junction endodeoxyribonuclease RusA
VITLQIGYPPSANKIWRRSGKRIHRSTQYVDWLEAEGWNIINQRQGGVSGPYRLAIFAVRPDRRRRDIDNLLKPLNDLLVSVGVVDDDSDAQSIHLEWVKEGPPVTVKVEKA